MINWKLITVEDMEITCKIAERAVKHLNEIGFDIRFIDIQMDIEACHVSGNPLKLQELLDADDSDFYHDILGIRRHINGDTGKLEDFFSPRFSA